MKKAIILLSGGLDSAVTLYLAKSIGYRCFCLVFDYGQRHKNEINAAKKIAISANSKFKILSIRLPWKASALLDKNIKVPHLSENIDRSKGIPVTYVPARNIIFLSFALSFAEAINAQAIFIGAHTQDYSNYPDCREEFFQSFQQVINRGIKAAVGVKGIRICRPLVNKSKAEIVKLGQKLGVPLELTWSCYRGGVKPCGECESCYFRAKGFSQAGIREN